MEQGNVEGRTDTSPQSFWLETLEGDSRFTSWVFDEMKAHLGPSILEVGCGVGTYTVKFAREAERVVALDIAPEFVLAAQRATRNLPGVEVRCADVIATTLGEGFDAAVMVDVLEHLPDESAILSKLFASLNPGGRIVVKVPAFSWLFGAMDRAVGHHRRYTRTSLARALRAVGFRDPTTWYFNSASIPGWWLNGVLLGRETPPRGQLSFFDRIVPLVRSVDRVTKPFLGLSIFGVAYR